MQTKDETQLTLRHFGGVPDGQTDNSPALDQYLAHLQGRGGGTLQVPDGIYGIRRTLLLTGNISLQMTPGATLLALPGFEGEAVVQGGAQETDRGERWFANQYILGGRIDGNKLPLVGLRIYRGFGITVENLLVHNALKAGIEAGVARMHEVSLSAIRILVDRDVLALPGSVGLRFILAHDSAVRDVVITGYETCVWCAASSVTFHMVHVWNWNTQVTLRTCFYDEGNQNSYNQCYADGPTVAADETGYGWYLRGRHTRVVNSLLYASHWTERDTMIGIHVAPEAKGCTFMGNHFMVCRPDSPQGGNKRHDMKAAFAGALDGACIFGNTYDRWIGAGKVFGPVERASEERSGGMPED